MNKPLNTLFDLDESGTLTHIQGVEVAPGPGILRVLTEHESEAPPRETAWALTGAYRFAKRLQRGSQVSDADDIAGSTDQG